MLIHLFFNDRRLEQNEALLKSIAYAKENNEEIAFVHILHQTDGPMRKYDNLKQEIFQMQCMDEINNSLGGNLTIFEGSTAEIIEKLILTKELNVTAISIEFSYLPWERPIQNELLKLCRKHKVKLLESEGFTILSMYELFIKNPGRTLTLPDYILEYNGLYHSVTYDTQTEKQLLEQFQIYKSTDLIEKSGIKTSTRLILNRYLSQYNESVMHGGASRGKKALETYVEVKKRNRLCENSKFGEISSAAIISPHISNGSVSVRLLFGKMLEVTRNDRTMSFLSMGIVQRDYYIMKVILSLRHYNWVIQDREMYTNDTLETVKSAKTGLPIIDAIANQIDLEGISSFIAKQLLTHFFRKVGTVSWMHGFNYFAHSGVDFDYAVCLFEWLKCYKKCERARVEDFGTLMDPRGDLIREYVDVLKRLPDSCIHDPSRVSTDELKKYNVILGQNYPRKLPQYLDAQ